MTTRPQGGRGSNQYVTKGAPTVADPFADRAAISAAVSVAPPAYDQTMSDTITVPPGDDTTTSSPSDPDSMRVAAVFGSEIPDFTITGPLDPDAVAAVYGDRYRTARLGEFSYVESDGGEEWAVSQCWLIAPDVPNDGVVDAINTAARMWMANTKDFDGLGAAEETMFAAVEEIPVRWFWEAGVIPAHRPAVQIEDLSDGYINPNGSWMDEDLTKLLEEN